ncbi:MAG: hypothetical protein J6J60_04895 [Clostridia bacterium]|nr:hypothetical protein [Clostridia bacterium]
MASENIKAFSITCENGVENYIYNIEKYNGGNYTLEKLETEDEKIGTSQYKRKFYLKNPLPEGNDLLFVSLNDKKIIINRYVLANNLLTVQKNVANISYEVVKPYEESEIQCNYMNDAKKAVCVFNVENKQEVIPSCYFDRKERKIIGKFRLSSNQKYVIMKLNNEK